MTELQSFVKKLEQRIWVPPDQEPQESLEAVFKGRAIELWSDALGERLWIVADEEDAAKLGEPRGTVYTAAEARCIIQIGDPATVAEVHDWKRRFEASLRQVNGRVREDR